MKCIMCGKIYKANDRQRIHCCSRYCYNNYYYNNHRETINARRRAWHKAHFIPKPVKPPKYSSEEERISETKKLRQKYYQENKERYKEYNKKWYKEHRNDPDVKRRHAIAMKKYNEKRKRLNGQGTNKSRIN